MEKNGTGTEWMLKSVCIDRTGMIRLGIATKENKWVAMDWIKKKRQEWIGKYILSCSEI